MIPKIPMFYRILKQYIFPWWGSEEKKVAWSGMIVLLMMSLVSVYIAVLLNNWNRDFFDAIGKKDSAQFLHQILIFIPLLGILIFDFCFRSWLTAWLSFRWRRWFTARLQKNWLSHKNFYKISLRTKEMDNPDQRISQDVSQICYTTISLILSFFREGVNSITFSIILWNLSRAFVFHLGSYQLHVPGLLVWASLFYSLIGTVFTFKIGTPIIDLNRVQEKREANFRYRLMRIFERREEIATFRGEQFEHDRLQQSFSELTINYYQVLKRQIYLNLFEHFYMSATMFVPLFLVGPLYFQGLITMGVLMQTQGMFSNVNSSLSCIMREFQSIAGGIASLQRVVTFNTMMESEDYVATPLPKRDRNLHIPSFTIQTPDQEKIGISPEIILKAGDRKVFMAPSGTGKTSFLRVLSGIYPHANGSAITLEHDVMIIPQRPYMPLGTLRQCLLYPLLETIDAEKIILFMKEAHLGHLIPLLDQVHDYQNRLSLGEQQRINFVRVLLHQPKWLFMDEPIAQLHKDGSEALFCLLTKNLPDSGIFIVSHQEITGFEKVTFKI